MDTKYQDIIDDLPEQEEQSSLSVAALSMTQLPWWIVSVVFHMLAILLLSLIAFAVTKPEEEGIIVVTTLDRQTTIVNEQEPFRNKSPNVLVSSKDVPPTDPLATTSSDVFVPPDVLARFELGDHWETNNPDKPDNHSAFGNPDSHIFYSETGSDDAAGGGGDGGQTFDDIIGIGAGTSPGTGGGWGGGDGTGIGMDKGNGRGSFGTRDGSGRRNMVMRHNGSSKTEGSVEKALAWLARNQEPDGHWDTKKFESSQKTDTAITGMALLSFLGAGHTEKVGRYKDNVKRAVAWLKSKQNAEGLVFDTTDAGAHRGVGYPHAIAGMALAEAAGMAKVPDTVTAAQKAVTYTIEKHQEGEGYEKGGFRYKPKQAGDLSVTGWYVMQLKSAKIAGLNVDTRAFEGALKFLSTVERKGAGGDKGYGPASVFSYTPTDEHSGTAHRLTAIGNLCKQFMGWKKEDLQSSVQWFVDKGGLPDGWGNDKTDLYYWYYGTLCTFQQSGDIWNRWNEAMKKTFVENQRNDGDMSGSWDPVGTYSNEWGRVGQTALSCLCLEVYYRYLPMYK